MWFAILVGAIVILGVVLRIMLAVQIAKRTGVHPFRQILNMWLCRPDRIESYNVNEEANKRFTNPIYSYLPSNVYHDH